MRALPASALAMGLWAAACCAVSAACASSAPAGDEARIMARLRRYETLVTRMDHAGIAAMFTRDGELAGAGGRPIVGPDSIRAHLESFRAFKVLGERLTSDSLHVAGVSATQWGGYWQRVRIPDGKVVEVHGRFVIDWRRDAVTWRLRRVATTPER